MRHNSLRRFVWLFGIAVSLLSHSLCSAFTISWDASPDPTVLGYCVKYGTATGNYTTTLDVRTATSAVIADPPAGVTYYLVVTAYAAASIESLPSQEVSYTVTTGTISADANLSGLTLSAGTLSPVFSSTATGYTASVSNTTTSITISPIAAQANATVKINGATVPSGTASAGINLAVGANTISAIVTAQDGTTTKTYTITITRAANNTAELSSLVTSAGAISPGFASGTTAYSMNVPNTTNSITITPVAMQSNATVKINGLVLPAGSASQPIYLGVGMTPISTVVTAQDGTTTRTYTLSVTRALSSNSNLASLTLSAGTLSPAFASGTTSYSASLPNGTTSIIVTPSVAQGGAAVRVNGFSVLSGTPSPAINVSAGGTTITIVVTAPDGSTKSYTLAVGQQIASDVAGSYNGLATPTENSTNRARHVGLGVLTVSSTGAFTGKITLGGSATAVPFSGTFGGGSIPAFSPSGTPTLAIARTGLPTLFLALSLEAQTQGTSRINGTLSEESGTIVSTLVLDKSFYTDSTTAVASTSSVPSSLLNTATDKGIYTAILQARTPAQQALPATAFPQGDGWATMTVQPTGTVSVSGRLADGQSFTYSAFLSKDNVLPLYLTPYSGAGTVVGSLTFRDVPAQSDVDGVGVQWFKPASPRDNAYREGWPGGIQVDLLGSKYVAPSLIAKTPLGNDPVMSPTVNGLFMLSDGGVVTPLSNNLSIGNTSRATTLGAPADGTAAAGLAVSLSSNGNFTGSFRHPTWKTTPTFAGVVMQKTQTAGGYFLTRRSSRSALQSGSATMSAVGTAPVTIAAN